MTDIELEINYLKGEIKSMHKMGLLVPSSTYERLHRLEKALEKSQKGEDSNESNISEWSGNFTRYYIGEWVKYKGITYKTLVNHVSSESLTPDVCPTFFEKIKE